MNPLRFLRRFLLVLDVVILSVYFTGCANGKLAWMNRNSDKSVPMRPKFIIGADISAVPAQEARGIKFSDNGVTNDVLQILKDHGFNYIRLRVFVQPTNSGGYSAQGFCDLPHTIAMAKRVK